MTTVYHGERTDTGCVVTAGEGPLGLRLGRQRECNRDILITGRRIGSLGNFHDCLPGEGRGCRPRDRRLYSKPKRPAVSLVHESVP